MKKKIIFGIAILAIVAVAAFNVNLNTNQKSELSFLALANVEALAQDENNGSIKWNCSTYTSDSYDQESYCYECQKYYVSSHWDTRSCDNGKISFCYPGYITTYYNCDGTTEKVNDQTSASACS